MKKYFLVLILATFISHAQTYSFDHIILVETYISKSGEEKFTNLSFMNNNDHHYVMFINEKSGVIRDLNSEMIHLFNVPANSPHNRLYHFEYDYSKKMNKGTKFKPELYEVLKLNDNEFRIKKFENKRKKNLEYQYTIQLEESPDDFLYVQFEKDIKKNNQLIDLIRKQLNPNKKYQIKSYQFKTKYREGRAKIKISSELDLLLELPKHLKMGAGI